jgi:DNA polymerase
MKTIIDKAEQYLRQQQVLFGERLFVEDGRPSTAALPAASVAVASVVTAPDTPQAASVAVNWREAASLQMLNETICECLNCKLGPTRTKFVFGVGNPNADVLVIGEAPGADEDAQGEPFVGRAGQLLNKILEAIQFQRNEVYIANIIKCRPPGNRRPEPDEVEQCEPYLHKQIDLIQPRLILALGLTAVNTLLKANFKMGEIRGKQLSFRGVPMIATYHPAALLRNPEWKKAAWEDVKLLRRLYDEGGNVSNEAGHQASEGTGNEEPTGLFG